MPTKAELDKLKESWLKDPCWDIEETEGFEEHKEELRAFRLEKESEWEIEAKDERERRDALVRERTGVLDLDIISVLNTWGEIENSVSSQDRYINQFDNVTDQVKVELMQAQVRATLLMAAQVKRVADALENLDQVM